MTITKDNFLEASYDVFLKFNKQLAVVSAGSIDDFGCMTIGWGMMGNVWGHPGSALTIYVSPARQTFEYLQKNDTFTVSFFPEAYHKDVITLGTKSGRDGNKIALTSLAPKAIDRGVCFDQAELTFVCRKIYARQFDIDLVPAQMRDNVYTKIPPHWFFIGAVEDAFGTVD